jgi:malonyl-CoA/methylmalonyl-CoA synthetase
VLRAGHVYLPLNNAYQSRRGALLHRQCRAVRGGVRPKNFGWVSKIAFEAGADACVHAGEDRTGTLLERAAQLPRRASAGTRGADDLAAILYTSGTTGRSKGRC